MALRLKMRDAIGLGSQSDIDKICIGSDKDEDAHANQQPQDEAGSGVPLSAGIAQRRSHLTTSPNVPT